MGDNDNDATSSLGCKNACSYKLKNDTYQGQKYCFGPGKQEVKCLSSEGNQIIADKDKRLDLQLIGSNPDFQRWLIQDHQIQWY